MKDPKVLKKNQPVSFLRPNSTMKTVLKSIQDGNYSRSRIAIDTRLRDGQVKSALYNLTFIGAVKAERFEGRTIYLIPTDHEQPRCSKCFANVNSIFNVAAL